MLERSFAFPAQILKLMVEEGVTGFPGVPTMFSILGEFKSAGDYDLSRIRYVTNTAAALLLKHIHKRCTYLPPKDLERKPGSVGIAIPNTEMWIVGEDGRRVWLGIVGQLVIRGPSVMKGYWERPEATASKLKPGPLPGEQVLSCTLLQDGRRGLPYVVGCMDDVIKFRGKKVAPKEVKSALMNIPGVREAAVIGVPDELLGQAVKAYVVLEKGFVIPEREIQKECQRRLENFMVPKYVVTVPSLPSTDTGKIKKLGLA